MRAPKIILPLFAPILVLPLVAQTNLPGYLGGLIPAPGATGVPVNAGIVVIGTPERWASQMNVTVRGPGGQAVELRRESGGEEALHTPVAALLPFTNYSVRIEPPASVGSPYETAFTTGAGPAVDPPRVAEFDPASGSAGVWLFGPFRVRFNRPVLNVSPRPLHQAIRIVNRNGWSVGSHVTLSPDGSSAEISLVSFSDPPTMYRILVDPEKLLDRRGVGGGGPSQEATLWTALAPDTAFEVLQAYPGEGAVNVPVNVRPQLLYNRQALQSPAGHTGRVRCGETDIPAQVEFRAEGRVVGLNLSQLLPPNSRCRWWLGSGVTDLHGIPATEFSAEFSTGEGPDIRRGQFIEASPAFDATRLAPANAWPRMRYNKPIHPVAARLAAVFSGMVQGLTEWVEADAEFFAEGTGVLFRPRAPLQPGVDYGIGAEVLRRDFWDVTGESFPTSDFRIRYREEIDTEPPQLAMTIPAAGARDVPPGAEIVLGFSEEMGAAFLQEPVQVMAEGARVAVQATRTPRTLRLRPEQVFKPNTTYEVRIRGLADLAGNPLPETSFEFRTADAAQPLPTFAVTSMHPENGALGVDPGTTIRLGFNLPVGGVLADSVLSIGSQSGPRLPFRTAIAGDRVEVTPLERLPVGSQISLSLTALDAQARTRHLWIQFQTEDASDGTFHIMSVTPEPGLVPAQRNFELTIRFQEPVNPFSLTSHTLLLDNGSHRISHSPTFSSDYREAKITVPGDAPLTVFASNGIRAMSGASLEPRFYEYWLEPQVVGEISSGRPESRPRQGEKIEPGDPFTVYLQERMSGEDVRRWALVTVDGEPWPGEFEVGASGHSLTFHPARQYPPSARVTLYERWRQASIRVLAEFITRTPGAALQHSVDPVTPMPRMPVLDFEFLGPVEPSDFGFVLTPERSVQGQPPIPIRVSKVRETTLRVMPEAPLADGVYRIHIAHGPAGGQPQGFNGTFQVKHRPDAQAAPLRVAPLRGSSSVPLNALISVLFHEAVNRTTVNRRTVRLLDGGQELPVQLELVNAGGLRLVPLVALRPDTEYRVVFEGVEDMQGRGLASPEWSFRTGRHLDFRVPAIVSSAQQGLGGMRVLAPDAAVRLEANEPLDPVAVALESAWPAEAWESSVSEDLRAAEYKSAVVRDRGAMVFLTLRRLRDLSGNASDSVGSTYVTAIAEDETPPRLLDLFPRDVLQEVPVNAQFAIRFDEPVDGASLSEIQFLRGNERLRLLQQPGPQSMLYFRPERMLIPGEEYRLVVEGVRDIWGNRMDGRHEAVFRAGALAETSVPVCRAPHSMTLPANAQITVTFSKPMSPPTILNGLRLDRQLASSNSAVRVPAQVLLATDGMSARVVPETPLEQGERYSLTGFDLRDYSGRGCSDSAQTSWTFWVGAEVHDPPRVSAVPADGATGVPRNVRAGVVFGRLVVPQTGVPVRLFCDGEEMRLLEQSSSPLLYTNHTGLLPRAATCRMQVASFEDYAGNRSAPFETTFTVADAASADSTRPLLVSTSPAAGEVGVNPAAPVVLNFNKPMRQPWAISPDIEVYASGLQWSFRGGASAAGRDISLTADPSWPAATTLSFTIRPNMNYSVGMLADLAGNRIDRQYGLTFHTAALPDTQPPRLEWVRPAPGEDLRARLTRFTLQFSEPVVTRPGALTLFAGTTPIPVSLLVSEDARKIEFNVQIPPEATLTLLLGELVTDLAGNPLAAQQFTWKSLEAEGYGSPQVSRVTPADHRQVESGELDILLEFSRPMSLPATTAAVRVMEGAEWVGGTVTMSENRREVRFKPDRAFKLGARVNVFVLASAMDVDGIPMHQDFVSRFYIAPSAGSAGFEVVRKSVIAGDESGRLTLELEFSQPVELSSVNENTVWVRIGSRRVYGVVSLTAGRLIHFRPDEAIREGEAMVLTAGAALAAVGGERFAGGDFSFAQADIIEEAELVAVVEEEDGTIRFRFGSPASAGARFNTQLEGAEELSQRFRWFESADRREWLLVPVAPLGKEPVTLHFNGKTVWRSDPASGPAAQVQ